MALPPWTVELLRRGVSDLARQASDPETAASLKEQATKLVDELPKAARAKVDHFLKQAETSSRPLRDAWSSGDFWQLLVGEATITGATPNRLINASGCLLHPRGSGVAMPTDVIGAAVPYLSGDGSILPDAITGLNRTIAETIKSRSDFHLQDFDSQNLGVFVTASFDSAIACIAAANDRHGRPVPRGFHPRAEIWTPRSAAVPFVTACTMHLLSGDDDRSFDEDALLISRLRRLVGGAIREFGRADRDTPPPSGWVGKDTGGNTKVDTGDRAKTCRHRVLVRLAGQVGPEFHQHADRNQWTDIVVMPIGSLLTLPTELSMIDSAVKQLQAGADAVVMAGGALSCTPDVGIVIGRGDWVRQLADSPKFQHLAAPPAMTAMVAAATRWLDTNESPLSQLASTSEGNLRDRAERLATQLSDASWVETAGVSDEPAVVGMDPTQSPGRPVASRPNDETNDLDQGRLVSRQVILSVKPSVDVFTLAERLANAPTGLLTRQRDGALLIDLRWVSPQQQSRMHELIKAV